MKGVEDWVPPLGPGVEVELTFIILGVMVGIEKLSSPISEEGVCTLVVSMATLVLLKLSMKKEGSVDGNRGYELEY